MPVHDLIVIGGGPGGYVAAIRAAQRGLNAAVVEKEEKLGGTCLRVGCIPSKALLESSHKYEEAGHELASHGVQVGSVALDLATMMRRKDEVVATLCKGIEALLKKNKVTRYSGSGRLAGPGRVEVTAADGSTTVLEAPRIVLAVGSRATVLPGVDVDGRFVGTSTEALSFDAVPSHLVVIGGGYIGLELGSVWRRLGAQVTVLEFADRILTGIDAEIASEALALFRKQGLDIQLGARVQSARSTGSAAESRSRGAIRSFAIGCWPRPAASQPPMVSASRQWGLPPMPVAGSQSMTSFAPRRQGSGRSAIASRGRCWPTRPKKTAWPVSTA